MQLRRARVLVLPFLLVGGVAFAFGKGPKEYEEPTGEKKVQKKAAMNTFAEAPENAAEDAPFPWKFAGMALLAFAAATPFAWRTYKSMQAESAETEAKQKNPARARRPKPEAAPETE